MKYLIYAFIILLPSIVNSQIARYPFSFEITKLENENEKRLSHANIGNYELALQIYNNRYKSPTILENSPKGYYPLSPIHIVRCKADEMKIIYFNFMAHIPMHYATIAHLLEFSYFREFTEIVIIQNKGDNYDLPPNPIFNQLLQAAKDYGYQMHILQINDELSEQAAIDTLCNMYYESNKAKTMIINEIPTHVAREIAENYEKNFVTNITTTLDQEIFAVSQIDDLNNYDKSVWPGMESLYFLTNNQGHFFRTKSYHNASLFTSLHYDRNDIAGLLHLRKFKIDEEMELPILVTAYPNLENGEKLVTDVLEIRNWNANNYILLEKEISYQLYYYNDKHEKVKEIFVYPEMKMHYSTN